MTKEYTLLKRDLLYFTTPESVDGYAKDVYEAMDEYAKIQSIAFAEWVDENGYTKIDSGDSVRWESLNDMSGKTSEELYNLFIESYNKQP